MVEIKFRSNACSCCGEGECSCTFPVAKIRPFIEIKLPKGINSIRVVKVKTGVYTNAVDYDYKIISAKEVKKFLRKNGKKIMEKRLGYKIIDYKKWKNGFKKNKK